MTFEALPNLPDIAGDAPYAPPNSTSTSFTNTGNGYQIQDVSSSASINPDGSVTDPGASTSSSFINYIETNIGNFAARIGVVILGFIFIAVALTMFGDKSVGATINKIVK